MYTLDINKALEKYADDSVIQYDLFRFTTCLQGILNRDKPTLFIFWEPQDKFWLDYMMSEGKFLHGEELTPLETMEDVLDRFSDTIRECGIALWDTEVPSTINAATTACGVDGYLPVRENSFALDLIRNKTGAEIKLDLTGKFTAQGKIWETDEETTGSRKCDAYIWALNKYMKKTSDSIMFFTVDGASWDDDRWYYGDMGNAFVPNMDYAVANRAFVFDLFCFDDEAPCDDKTQPLGTDLRTMKRILRAQYDKNEGKKITTVCGFNPWHVKYTDIGGKNHHEGVESEWRLGEILSSYNCVKDADAAGYCGLADASVYRHFPLKKHYTNRKPNPPKEGYDKNKTYILFYVGDYDAAAWTARFIPRWYKDENLGKLPLMWCFNPNLSDRIPQAFDFIYENYTDNDYFEAGDSGAGYNNPRLLYTPRIFSDLPSGVETNVEHNLKYFEQFDLSVIGFVINGVHKTDTNQMYDLSRFAKGGVAYNGYGEPAVIVNGVPFMTHTCDLGAEHIDTVKAAHQAVDYINNSHPNKKFHIFRTILVSPTDHVKILDEMKRTAPEKNIELLDPITFFAYLKTAVEEGNTY